MRCCHDSNEKEPVDSGQSKKCLFHGRSLTILLDVIVYGPDGERCIPERCHKSCSTVHAAIAVDLGDHFSNPQRCRSRHVNYEYPKQKVDDMLVSHGDCGSEVG